MKRSGFAANRTALIGIAFTLLWIPQTNDYQKNLAVTWSTRGQQMYLSGC